MIDKFVAPFNDYMTDIRNKNYSLTATFNHRWVTENSNKEIGIKHAVS